MYLFIDNPILLTDKLAQLFETIYDLFELTGEDELPPKIGGTTLYDENGKCYFQVSSQYERPADFFDSFLDLIRVMFEPNPLGTFFLNSNPEFLLNAIPKNPFRLGYIKAISLPNESIAEFFERDIAEQLKKNNYSLASASACFVMISVNSKKYSSSKLGIEALKFFNSGFTVEEVFKSIKVTIEDQEYIKFNNTHVGFSIDNSLQGEMRLSMWLFI